MLGRARYFYLLFNFTFIYYLIWISGNTIVITISVKDEFMIMSHHDILVLILDPLIHTIPHYNISI